MTETKTFISRVFLFHAALKDPCTEVTCSYGSTCVQSSDGLSAKCMCPLGCEGRGEQTVCGSDGKDYRNECELHQHACKNQKNIRVQYQGHCGKLYPSAPISSTEWIMSASSFGCFSFIYPM